jgi:hypothetical protein
VNVRSTGLDCGRENFVKQFHAVQGPLYQFSRSCAREFKTAWECVERLVNKSETR